MKYLIVGVGNPGAKYENTRHNIGFLVADKLAKELDCSFAPDSHGELAVGKHKGRTLYILKPNTFMNLSGKAVNYWLTKLKIKSLDNLLVIVDDLHLDLGVVRLRKKGSDGGHNGLRDIQARLGTTKYPRLRMGIGSDFHSGQQIDYVLGQWPEEDRSTLEEMVAKGSEVIMNFVTIGSDRTMNTFNNK
ncbi:aminoacyl-tRNA hydrolase [Membranihabitans maritimus]|uniref:aminoacyl-tRNA hydrolase n=1 Tax=Membranihabitans maritimus TaxID=2904244 RepID=UPI001F0082A5|nr:aminoacyl-tRNA hydrolase [Membranihabitans maritimus]